VAQEQQVVADRDYDRGFWAAVVAEVRRTGNKAPAAVAALKVPADVAARITEHGGRPSHLAQKLTQEIRSLIGSLADLSYDDQQLATALERTYRLIVERVRVELATGADPSDGDKPARAACAAVFACTPDELHLLEFDDDRRVPCRAMFPRSALAKCEGLRKQLRLIQASYPTAREHNVFQFCNDFDVLFSATDAAVLWSSFAIAYQVTYWTAERRIYDWSRVRKFGLP
jgi:hypothetical protein